MKKKAFILWFFLLSSTAWGQVLPTVKYDSVNTKIFNIVNPNGQVEKYKLPYLSMTFLFLGGVCDGFAETLKFHYDHFKHRFPNAKDNLWNPDLSWKLKWKNGDPEQGERYFQSSRLLAWTTDPYHKFRSGSKAFVCGAIVVKIGGHKKFKYYIYDFMACSAAYSLGFSGTFDVFLKNH